jgi:hypothetical protein
MLPLDGGCNGFPILSGLENKGRLATREEKNQEERKQE